MLEDFLTFFFYFFFLTVFMIGLASGVHLIIRAIYLEKTKRLIANNRIQLEKRTETNLRCKNSYKGI